MRGRGGTRLNIAIYTQGTKPIICSIFIYLFIYLLKNFLNLFTKDQNVTVITMQKLFSQVINTAKLLETESGGILVSVDKLKEGHAIIIYRGKNYKRPSIKLAKHLLTKREALRRSLEMQRIGVSDCFLLHPLFPQFFWEIHIQFLYYFSFSTLGAFKNPQLLTASWAKDKSNCLRT